MTAKKTTKPAVKAKKTPVKKAVTSKKTVKKGKK